jgi:hypothetical protein
MTLDVATTSDVIYSIQISESTCFVILRLLIYSAICSSSVPVPDKLESYTFITL